MIRTSNRKNAGSRRNKKHRFVPFSIKEARYGHWEGDMFVMRGAHDYMSKPNHAERYTDIRDCFPLIRLGHI